MSNRDLAIDDCFGGGMPPLSLLKIMKAVYIKEFGDIEELEFRDVDDPPKPAGSEILVRVRAAGLNRADLLQRRGLYPPPAGYDPNIPGLEFAGEIEEVGRDVNGLAKGDRVFGIAAGEAQAELLLIDASLAARIPDNLNFVEAAATPEAFITAHDSVFIQAQLRAGESLLIHAVGSGVGLAALQIAKANGNEVFGTSRTLDKLERCAQFGLDHAIASKDGNFADAVAKLTGGTGVDIILDLVGGSYFEQNLRSLKTKGRLMLVGTTSGSRAEIDLSMAMRRRLKIIGTVLRPRPTEEKAEAVQKFADDIVPLLEKGVIVPNIDKVFAAKDVGAAHEHLESNESFGKVILEF